jgi:ribosomal protein S1
MYMVTSMKRSEKSIHVHLVLDELIELNRRSQDRSIVQALKEIDAYITKFERENLSLKQSNRNYKEKEEKHYGW